MLYYDQWFIYMIYYICKINNRLYCVPMTDLRKLGEDY